MNNKIFCLLVVGILFIYTGCESQTEIEQNVDSEQRIKDTAKSSLNSAVADLKTEKSSGESHEQEPIIEDDTSKGISFQKDISYVNNGGDSHKLDLYWHKNAGKSAPLIIWIHGGAWQGGDKQSVSNFALKLLEKGYAVAAINYRLSQEAKFPAQIQDCKAAVRWLRTFAWKYRINPKKFGAWGDSAGGHLASLLGTAGEVKEWDNFGDYRQFPSDVQAVCDFCGPTDFSKLCEQPNDYNCNEDDFPPALLIGGSIKDNPEKSRAANPIGYITPEDPPFLILHGLNDRKVIPGQSRLLHEALQKAGVESELVLLPDKGHGGEEFVDQLDKIESFFDNHLK